MTDDEAAARPTPRITTTREHGPVHAARCRMLANAFLIAAIQHTRVGPELDQKKARRYRRYEARAQELARDFEAWALIDPPPDKKMRSVAAMMDLEVLGAEVGVAELTEAPQSIR